MIILSPQKKRAKILEHGYPKLRFCHKSRKALEIMGRTCYNEEKLRRWVYCETKRQFGTADMRPAQIRAAEREYHFTHSSMRSLGPVEGGCETVLAAMKEAVGEEGTLLFPAFTFDVCTKPPYYFSMKDSRCCVGALPEYARTQPDFIRSVHPSHSVSAWGKRAEEMTREHILDYTPVGPHSPLALLPKVSEKC